MSKTLLYLITCEQFIWKNVLTSAEKIQIVPDTLQLIANRLLTVCVYQKKAGTLPIIVNKKCVTFVQKPLTNMTNSGSTLTTHTHSKLTTDAPFVNIQPINMSLSEGTSYPYSWRRGISNAAIVITGLIILINLQLTRKESTQNSTQNIVTSANWILQPTRLSHLTWYVIQWNKNYLWHVTFVKRDWIILTQCFITWDCTTSKSLFKLRKPEKSCLLVFRKKTI